MTTSAIVSGLRDPDARVVLLARFRSTSWCAAAVTVGVGVLALGGWLLGVGPLTTLGMGPVAVKPNAAACFVVAGAALVMRASRPLLSRYAVIASGAIVAATATATLLEYVLAIDLGIDALLVSGAPAGGGSVRMSFNAALALASLGGAIALSCRTGRAIALTQALALGASAIAFLSLTGHAFGVVEFQSMGFPAAIAFPSAVAVLAAAVSLLLANPTAGFMRFLGSGGAGGALVRRVLGWALLLPLAVELAAVAGSRAGLYGAEWAPSLSTVAVSAILCCIIVVTARQLDGADAARRATMSELARIRAAIETSGDAIAIVGNDGRTLYQNAAFHEAFGYGPTDLNGSGGFATLYEEPQIAQRIVDALARDGAWEGEVAMRTRAGDRRYVLLRADTIRDDDGSVIGRVKVHTDITARKVAEDALRQSELRYRSLFDHMTSGFALHRMIFEGDRPVDYVFLEANAAFEEQTSLRREDILGKRVGEVLPGLEPSWLERYGAVARTGVPLQFEQEAAALGRWYTVTAYSPGPGLFATVFDDITDRKRHEQEVSALNADLRRRRDELTAANALLEQQRRDLVASNSELEAFAYSVSHDLRAPLRSIAGFSQAVLEDYGSRLDETGRQYLQLACDGSREMGQLIDDLLSLSRVARVEMARGRVDLGEVARSIFDDLRASDPERRVDVDVASGLVVEGDPTLLRLVVDNLIRNAWKFTSRHASARIRIGRTRSRGVDALFVADDGAGFDMKYVSKLLRPFSRLHSAEEFPGTGIGLAIVNRIVRRHGGEVWAEGQVEKGATFYFTLPTAEGSHDSQGHPARRGQPEGRPIDGACIPAEQHRQ